MLVGAYPFEDPEEPKNFRKTIQVTIDSVSQLKCVFVVSVSSSSVGMLAANLERSVLDPRLCSYITRMSSSDLKDICGGPCKGQFISFRRNPLM